MIKTFTILSLYCYLIPADCDDTYVCSLFDNNSDVIGEMAFLLDMQKVGLKNWSKLAAELGIPRKVFKTFGTNNSTNPTQTLFELLTIKFPWLTIQELVGHLEDMERHDVANAVRSSKKGKLVVLISFKLISNLIFLFFKLLLTLLFKSCDIDRMHKWRPKVYSFVYVLIRLTSLALKQPFFCILCMQTRLVSLIST